MQQRKEAEKALRSLRQNGAYIETYISHFSVLASQAGITDATVLGSYFQDGLDRDIRTETIRQNPTDFADWKTKARIAYTIDQNLKRNTGTSHQRTTRNQSRRNRGGYKSNIRERYINIHDQPTTRNEWDMDIDNLYHNINQLAMDDRDGDDDLYKSEGEDSDYRSDEDDDEDINFIKSTRNSYNN